MVLCRLLGHFLTTSFFRRVVALTHKHLLGEFFPQETLIRSFIAHLISGAWFFVFFFCEFLCFEGPSQSNSQVLHSPSDLMHGSVFFCELLCFKRPSQSTIPFISLISMPDIGTIVRNLNMTVWRREQYHSFQWFNLDAWHRYHCTQPQHDSMTPLRAFVRSTPCRYMNFLLPLSLVPLFLIGRFSLPLACQSSLGFL